LFGHYVFAERKLLNGEGLIRPVVSESLGDGHGALDGLARDVVVGAIYKPNAD